jgi:hypothetical protein
MISRFFVVNEQVFSSKVNKSDQSRYPGYLDNPKDKNMERRAKPMVDNPNLTSKTYGHRGGAGNFIFP